MHTFRKISVEEGFFGSLFAAGAWIALVGVTENVVPLFTAASLRLAVGML